MLTCILFFVKFVFVVFIVNLHRFLQIYYIFIKSTDFEYN